MAVMILNAVRIFGHNWYDIFYYRKVIIQIYTWSLYWWSSQVTINNSNDWALYLSPVLNIKSENCRYFSMVAVGVGVVLFLLTSFSDPGTVTAENVSQYLAAYPYDNIIYAEKECSTCKITKYTRLSIQLWDIYTHTPSKIIYLHIFLEILIFIYPLIILNHISLDIQKCYSLENFF